MLEIIHFSKPPSESWIQRRVKQLKGLSNQAIFLNRRPRVLEGSCSKRSLLLFSGADQLKQIIRIFIEGMAGSRPHLALYMVSLFIAAIPFSSMGALIPFLAADLGIEETEYSILFAMVSVATFIAALAYKALGYYRWLPKYHTVMIVSSLEVAVFSVVFIFMETKNTQILVISIVKLFNYINVVTGNICLMMAPPKQEIGLWMSFSHGAYGVGALVGPLLVGVLEEKFFLVVAGASLAVTPFFFILQSPEEIPRTEEQMEQQGKSKEGPLKLEILVSAALFVLVGIEATIQGWAPTYAVQTGVAGKQQAVTFTSIFWTIETIFRFVFGWVSGTDSGKLTYSVWGQLLAGVVATSFALFHSPVSAAYSCSVLYGVALAMAFPLLLSASHEFGIHFTGDQISNMMISVTISTGVYAMLTGVLMKSDPNMFLYSLLGYSAILVVMVIVIMKNFEAEATVATENKSEPVPAAEDAW